jgi:DNA-binding transcriptional regulator PaaX
MSLIFDMLKELYDTELNYKGHHVNIFGSPRFKKYNSESLRISAARLKKKGYITGNGKSWNISNDGKKYVINKRETLKQFSSSFRKDNPKNLLIIFDIIENRKAERDWLRFQLKKFGYLMIQRSVWVGPSPLPKEFVDYLQSIKLKASIKTFKLAKPYKF